MVDEFNNIILIGMPAVGKSTIGVLLAKRLGFSFLDTDLLIQVGESEKLQNILDEKGMDDFCTLEERYVLTVRCENHVIATGGSVVYGEKAMAHLKSMGFLVHLDLAPQFLEQRLKNLSSRGVVMARGQDIQALYFQRLPLYNRYADVTVACDGLSMDDIVNEIEGLWYKREF